MADNPLKVYETLDPELLQAINSARDMAFNDGALSRRVKILIAVALDAQAGAVNGVHSLTDLALKSGASREEIAETLRVVYYISGAGGVYTAAHGIGDVLS